MYQIREMTAMDVHGVAAVEQDVFTTAWSAEMFAEEMNNELTTYLLVCMDEEIIGFAGFWLVVDEAQVTNIAIKQDWQSRGYGRVLVNSLMQSAKKKGAGSISLEVRVSNKRALKLYAKLGFKKVGIRPGYYQDNGENAILMTCKLLDNQLEPA